MNKVEAQNFASKNGAGFLANVIANWHRNPAKKLKGLVNLIQAGHSVALPVDMDHLQIDGVSASWIVLEEWATRKN